jgi:hypothetical protein
MSSSARYAIRYEVMPPRLLRAYRQTRYSAVGVVVRVGRCVPDVLFAKVGAREAVFVTAWNPRSRRMPWGWNARMQRRLAERLRRFVVVPADGTLGCWHEAHLLVVADVRQVLRLARIFRQLGVVAMRRGRPARLVLLRQSTPFCARVTCARCAAAPP